MRRSLGSPRMTVLSALVTRGASMAMSIVMTLLISRWMAAADPSRASYGAWAYLFTVLTALATVARMGAENLAVKLSAADAAASAAWVRPALLATIGLGALMGAGLVPLALSKTGGPAALPAALAFGTAVVATNLATLAGAWLRGLGRVSSGAFLELGCAPALTILALAAWAVSGHRVTTVVVVTVWAAALWATALVALLLVARAYATVPGKAAPAGLATYARRHGRALASFMVTALGFFLFAQLPVIILGARHADVAVGEFRNATTLANFVGMLPLLQLSYLTPQFARLHHQGERAALQRTISSATRLATLAGVVVALPLLAFPEFFLELFGRGYGAAAGTLRILAAGQLALAFFGSVYGLLTTVGLERAAGRLMLALLPVGALAIWVAVPLGSSAVAVASLVAPLGFAVLGAWLARSRRGLSTLPFGGLRP